LVGPSGVFITFGIGQPPARVTHILKPIPDMPPFHGEPAVKHEMWIVRMISVLSAIIHYGIIRIKITLHFIG
jgi:hypothetical protein